MVAFIRPKGTTTSHIMADYIAFNTDTIANIVAQSPTYAKEIVWMARVAQDDAAYNPFADLMGGFDSVKPIKEVVDTQKIKGTTLVISRMAGLGGKGVQGATKLVGNEEKLKYNQFLLQIGLHRHAVAIDKMVKDQTAIGSAVDTTIRNGLRQVFSRLKCDCIEAAMIGESDTRNTLYANGRASLDVLGSQDYINQSTISQAKIMMNGLGGSPIEVARRAGNQRISMYYFQGNDRGFEGMRNNGQFQAIESTAGNRGDDNFVFGGHLPKWQGVMLNEWEIRNESADAAQGAFCQPKAYLGEAIPAKATTDDFAAQIKGGGWNGNSTLTTIAAAKTGNDYFRYFPNAPFAAFDRTIVAAATTRRYAMIQHASGADIGKFSFISYTDTDAYVLGKADFSDLERLGSTITGDYVTTLTGSSITWGTAPWTTAYLSEGEVPIGSLIVPVNAKGQPWVRSYMLGNDAIVTGYGSIDGKASSAFGQRVTETQDYQRDQGIGAELVWGVKCMENGAGIKNGYVLVYGAYNLPGMPDIDAG